MELNPIGVHHQIYRNHNIMTIKMIKIKDKHFYSMLISDLLEGSQNKEKIKIFLH